MRFARVASLLCLAGSTLLGLVVACSADPKTKDPLPLKDDPNGNGDDTSPAPTQTGTSSPVPDTPLPEAAAGTGRMFAHTADTLYEFEPIKHTLKKIGVFGCLDTAGGDSVLDIALDRTEQMYGTTRHNFIKIDPLTAKCQIIHVSTDVDPYPNSLSFVPAGTVDATKEVLVGYKFKAGQAVSYVSIRTSDGTVSDELGDLNTLSEPNKWAASGDLISLIQAGNKSYLTVKLQTQPDSGAINDSLAEIDPTNGRIKSIIGQIGEMQTYGLGYWAGKGYGFAGNGHVIEIDMTNGSSTLVQTNVDPSTGALLPWYGAGVGTNVPIK